MPEPQVAQIGQNGSNPSLGISTLEQLAGLASPVQVPSQTVPVHQSNPRLPQKSELQDHQRVGPITGQVADVKRARRENAVGGVVNSLNQFTRQFEQKHIENVTHDVNTLMNAQQQIDNANAVLQNPSSSEQDKKNAQGVMDQNKKISERMLSDPKTRKTMQKAFDISFTDPEKNNTPEVKAMQAAKAKFDSAKQAGLDYNTPEERKIGELANNPPQEQQQRRMITAGTNESKTPYADQFFKSQMQGLAANPSYAPAVKQLEEQQKNVTGVLKTKLQQEGLNNREQNTQNQTNERARLLRENQLKVNKDKITGLLKAVNIRVAGMLEDTRRKTTSWEKIASLKTTAPDLSKKLIAQSVAEHTNAARGMANAIDTIKAQITKITNDPTITDPAARKSQIEFWTESPGGLKELQGQYTDQINQKDSAEVQLRALGVGGNNGGLAKSGSGFKSEPSGNDPISRIQNTLQNELGKYSASPQVTNGYSTGSDDEEGNSETEELLSQ